MRNKVFLIAFGFLFTSGASQAALYDRGSSLIYDDVLDVTWLQDANYSKTTGYSSDGSMTWVEADAWAQSLDVSGITNWRLPSTKDFGGDGCNWSESSNGGGGTDCGYSVAPTSSEMANLFHTTLGNNAYNTWPWADNTYNGLKNSGLFINIQPNTYWSSTVYALDPNSRWFFSFGTGLQRQVPLYENAMLYAWAVHDGDVAAIPEPETYAMLLIGLAMMGFVVRRRRNNTQPVCL